MAMRSWLFPLVVLLFPACAKGPGAGPVKPTATAQPAEAGWLVYEDDWVRAAYPPGSDVVGAEGGRQNRENPNLIIVPPPEAGKTVIGGVAIQLHPRTKGMLLRDAIHSEVQLAANARAAVLSGPKAMNVKNARCMGVLINAPSDYCPVGGGKCFLPTYRTLCDGPDGRRYDIMSVLTKGGRLDALAPVAQQQAALYDRILASLEFKTPAP